MSELSLYQPLVERARWALGHLGQSIDGFIAGTCGDAENLSSTENIVHLHRLRALSDAIVVGGRTAQVDNPRLTTRLVTGPSPVRVVIDPSLRTDPTLRLYGSSEHETLLVCSSDAPGTRRYPSSVRIIRLALSRAELDLSEVFEKLAAEGLPRVFVEGGGVLVSRCVLDRALDILQLTIAPIVIGAGVRGIELGDLGGFECALRPPSRRFEMGRDVLFEFALR